MKEGKGGWERSWGPQGTGVRGSGWVGLLQGGSLMAGEKEVTLPRPLDLHRPWPCSSGPLRRREGASTLGAYTYNPYSLSMESSL